MRILVVDAGGWPAREMTGRYRPLAGTDNDRQVPASGRHYQM
jgi:hypothetical protein